MYKQTNHQNTQFLYLKSNDNLILILINFLFEKLI